MIKIDLQKIKIYLQIYFPIEKSYFIIYKMLLEKSVYARKFK